MPTYSRNWFISGVFGEAKIKKSIFFPVATGWFYRNITISVKGNHNVVLK